MDHEDGNHDTECDPYPIHMLGADTVEVLGFLSVLRTAAMQASRDDGQVEAYAVQDDADWLVIRRYF